MAEGGVEVIVLDAAESGVAGAVEGTVMTVLDEAEVGGGR